MKKILATFLIFVQNLSAESKVNNTVGKIQNTLNNEIKVMETKIKPVAIWVFWTFALIEIVIVFGFMLMKQELEIGAVFANLVRLILIFGLFFWFFQNTSVLESIFDGFVELGSRANSSGSLKLDTVIEQIGEMWVNVGTQVSIMNIGNSILIIVLAGFATVALVMLIGRALTIYLFFLFSLYVGVLFFAFASLSYTRTWAINGITNIIRSGVKFMMSILVMGLMISLIISATKTAMEDTGALMQLFIISFLTWSFINGIDSWVDSYFTGMGSGENMAGVQLAKDMMMGSMAGAVGGTMAGYNAVKTASSGTNETSTNSSGSSSSGNKTWEATKTASGAIAGGFAGAITGGLKGGMGFNITNAGQKSGTGVVAGVQKTASLVKSAVGGNNQSNNSQTSNKDRNGFNMDNLKKDESSSGTISKG